MVEQLQVEEFLHPVEGGEVVGKALQTGIGGRRSLGEQMRGVTPGGRVTPQGHHQGVGVENHRVFAKEDDFTMILSFHV